MQTSKETVFHGGMGCAKSHWRCGPDGRAYRLVIVLTFNFYTVPRWSRAPGMVLLTGNEIDPKDRAGHHLRVASGRVLSGVSPVHQLRHEPCSLHFLI